MRTLTPLRPFIISGLVAVSLFAWGFQPQAQARLVVPNGKAYATGMLTRFYYELALQSAANGKMDLSLSFMDKVYEMNRHDLQIALTYAAFLQSQGHYTEAISVYNNLLAGTLSPLEQSSLYYQIALLNDDLNQSQQSITAMKKAIEIYPGKIPAEFYYDMGIFYSKLNQYEKTSLYSHKAVEEAPNSSEAWNNWGYSLAKLGKYEEGLKAIQKSLAIEPKNANTLDSMGYILFKMKRFHQSIQSYEEATHLDPKMTESFFYLGQSYEATQAWQKAIDAYQKFLTLSQDQQERAFALTAIHRLQKWVPQNEKTTSTDPTHQDSSQLAPRKAQSQDIKTTE